MEDKVKEVDNQKSFQYLDESIQQELLNKALAIMDVPRGMMMLDVYPEALNKMFDEKETIRERFIKLIISTNFDDSIASLAFPEDMILIFERMNNIKVLDSLRNQGYILGFKASHIDDQLFLQKEFITTGLDYLEQRCKRYKELGYDFAIWENLIHIGKNTSSHQYLTFSAENSAKFAAICQFQSIVPIVRFEISNEGSYTIESARQTLEKILTFTFRSFTKEKVFLESLIIQTTLLRSGNKSGQINSPLEIVEKTINTFSRTLLTAIRGIQIISETLPIAEADLAAFFNYRTTKKPWLISFAVGRNLLTLAFNIWKENFENVLVKDFLKEMVSVTKKACLGKQEHLNESCLENKTILHYSLKHT